MERRVFDLRCQHIACPMGIDTEEPVFSWQTAGEGPVAFRLRVWGSEGEVCDSGWREDYRPGGFCPGHMELARFFRYEWSVEVRFADGGVEKAESFFLMGILRVSEWKSQMCAKMWKSTVYYFRTEFDVERPQNLRRAYLFIAAQGSRSNAVSPSINGQLIRDLPLFPGLMEYFHGVYTACDVLGLLRERNALGIKAMRTFSVVLSLEWEDGRRQVKFFDRGEFTRQVETGYRTLGYEQHFHGGKSFEFDANKDPEGFDLPGFDETGWERLITNDFMNPGIIRLTPQLCRAEIRKTERPERITRCGDHYTVDFGHNGAGYVRFRLRGKAGQRVELWFSEKMAADGVDAWQSELFPPYYTYTFARDGEVEFEPEFMHTGFRAVRVFGLEETPGPECFTAVRLSSRVDDATEFDCSDEDISLILHTARESFVSNLLNVPTDCPERERRGWMGDAFAVCEAEFLSLDVRTFYAQWMESMRDSQRTTGWIPVELPMSTDSHMDVNWGAAAVIVPWIAYQQTGDVGMLAHTYGLSKAWVDMLWEITDPDGGVCPLFMAYADWVSLDPASSDYLGRCYYFRCTDLLRRMAETLGYGVDEEKYRRHADFLREQINARYLHRTAEGVSYDTGSQSALCHALRFEICPEADRIALRDALVRKLTEDGHSTTGFLGSACLLNCLADYGREDVAYRMLKNEEMGGWIWLLRHCGATTFPETWNGGGSQNHAFLGSAPVEFYVKSLCGVRPAKPGYTEVSIRPYLASGLDRAGCRLQTEVGCIASSWERKGERVTLTVEIPWGVTARVDFGGETRTVTAGRHEFTAENK